ncbi:DUF4336 domain-containing protein [Roseofilum sp. Guam]|uniref:DUF4336 domain-containing protein n=1 Tax=Roseofilum sp. Guam TaxID=2821502 RepID=UPI001B042870|nr:DUF4336 domain-containing protein [Roseofilum sp. Guam]MBP0029979.1 DUF4336 domain-containing protein [Roseofilum sp. Guam]
MGQDAIALYEPINTLKQIGEDIWIVDGPIVRMSLYGGKIPFPTRMTIVRLSNSELWCHSPTELTPELKAQIDSLGSVRHLISPNKIHYTYIASWAKAYPEAIAWASPGVRDQAAQQKIEVSFNADLDNEPPLEWAADLDQLFFRGIRFMEEVVFFHPKNSTLILTDLIENFELNKVNKWFGLLIKLIGVADPDGKTALDLRITSWGQKDQCRSCFKQMVQWHPEKIIIAHGRWYENNALAELHRAFRWLD